MEIVSTMGSGSLGREINLQELVIALQEHLAGTLESSSHGTSMVTIRFEEGGPAYTLYRTGTFQIRGAKDPDVLKEAKGRLLSTLDEIGLEVSEHSFEQKTAVFMEDLRRKVNLEALAVLLGLQNTEYEPEQFPGLVYRPEEYGVTLLVFASGKVIIGGTTSHSLAEEAVNELRNEVEKV